MDYTQPKQNSIKDQIIDIVFQHVANMYVLKQILSGKSWSESLGGEAGQSHPISWHAKSKGIYYDSDGFISITEILSRADKWQTKGQLELF